MKKLNQPLMIFAYIVSLMVITVAANVKNETQLNITYPPGQDKILAVNLENRTVTVANSTTVAQIVGVLKHAGGDAITVTIEGKKSGLVANGDRIRIVHRANTFFYDIIVMDDPSSTDVRANGKVAEEFHFEFHGSNIGKIDNKNNVITLIDGMARYFTMDELIWYFGSKGTTNSLDRNLSEAANRITYTGRDFEGAHVFEGRHRSLRSANDIITQIESVNGTSQTYRIVSAVGVHKTNALPETGDKLIVTAQNGVAARTFNIVVEQAALSGKLYVTCGPSTVGTKKDLILHYHAGQRSNEAEVVFKLPPGVNANHNNTFVNLIGRGEVRLDRFHLSRGVETDGVFERQDMHRVLGRFSVDYPYQTLGTVIITGDVTTGKTITFRRVDLRPNNGVDFVLRIEDVGFDTVGEKNFSASLKTMDYAIAPSIPALQSFGQASEATAFNVVHNVTSLKREIFNDVNFENRQIAYNNGVLDGNFDRKGLYELGDLEYKEGARAGDYTGFTMFWTPPVGATSITIQHSTGNLNANGDVTLNNNWVDVGTLPLTATKHRINVPTPNAYHRYRIYVTGGLNPGASNEVGFYSGKLDVTKVGAIVRSPGSASIAEAHANRDQINKAINWLSSIGGGTLLFPKMTGSIQTGTVRLKSNVILYLDSGAHLQGRNESYDNPEPGWFSFADYASGTDSGQNPYRTPDNFLSKQDDGHSFYQNSMFYGRRNENIKIIGTGRLEGTGLHQGDRTVSRATSGDRANKMVSIKLGKNFELGGISRGLDYDLTFDVENRVYLFHNQSPAATPAIENGTREHGKYHSSFPRWIDKNGNVAIEGREFADNMLKIDRGGHFATLVIADHHHIHNVYYGMFARSGRDVFDVMQSSDVYVTNIMASGVSDDIVALKSASAEGFTRPARGFFIRNIVGDTNCNNFQIGSETADDKYNIYIDNLVVLGAGKCGFSVSSNDGGVFRNINLNTGHTGRVILPAGGHLSRTRTPIFITISHRGRIIGANNVRVNTETGEFEAPSSGSTSGNWQRVITNVPLGRVEDLTLNNIDIYEVYNGTAYAGDYYPYGGDAGNRRHDWLTSLIAGYAMPANTEKIPPSVRRPVTADGINANYIGMPDERLTGYIKNITFNGLNILMKGNAGADRRERVPDELNVGGYNSPNIGTRPSYGLFVTHVKNFTYNGGHLGFEQNDDTYAIVFNNTHGIQINDLIVDKGKGNGVSQGPNADGLIQLRKSTNMNIVNMGYREGSTPLKRMHAPVTERPNAFMAAPDRANDVRPIILVPNVKNFGNINESRLIYPRDVANQN